MRRTAAVLVVSVASFVAFAAPGCGGSSDGLASRPDGGGGITTSGCGSCDGNVYAVCNGAGVITERRDCAA